MCIDNETQYVVAVVGGRTQNDQYNRAFLSKRQPGSTIKPLLDYAPAIDNGVINGSTVINVTRSIGITPTKKATVQVTVAAAITEMSPSAKD